MTKNVEAVEKVLCTVFSPGGFEKYLAEMAAMSEAQLADAALMRKLAEQYDIWLV